MAALGQQTAEFDMPQGAHPPTSSRLGAIAPAGQCEIKKPRSLRSFAPFAAPELIEACVSSVRSSGLNSGLSGLKTLGWHHLGGTTSGVAPNTGPRYRIYVRIVKRSTLKNFARAHPDAREPLAAWMLEVRKARWRTPQEALAVFPKASILGPRRVKFNIHGGAYRLVVHFNFVAQAAFIRFIGTHEQYDRIDATTV